jgi:hypothetical protein
MTPDFESTRVGECFFFPQNKNFGGRGVVVGTLDAHPNRTIAIFPEQMTNLETICHASNESGST